MPLCHSVADVKEHANVWLGPLLPALSESQRTSAFRRSVKKQRVACAESVVLNRAQAPFLSGFARLLRCRKDLGQFPEVLGGCGEEEFVICAAWAT